MDQHGSPWYAEGLSALILAKLLEMPRHSMTSPSVV